MTAFLIKHWKSIVQALVVVAVIVLISIINPFGIFGKGLKLQPTSNQVTAIREIGQLVTAEYYGEVISTLNRTKLEIIAQENLNARANLKFRQLKMDMAALYQNSLDNNGQNSNRHFSKNLKNGIETLFFDADKRLEKDSMESLSLEYFYRFKQNNFEKLKESRKIDFLKDALWTIMEEVNFANHSVDSNALNQYLAMPLPSNNEMDFSGFCYDLRMASESNKERKKKLALIGRGWVKAGFNFGTLDESNMIIRNGVVYLYGMQPEILDSDINPWFIPERGVPGFQIIQADGKVDFEDARMVKMDCVDRLNRMAIQAGILEQAEKQGKETIKTFIGLLTGQEVTDVVFSYDPFSLLSKSIAADAFVSYDEAILFDSLVNSELFFVDSLNNTSDNVQQNKTEASIRYDRLRATVLSFKKLEFAHWNCSFNKYSSIAFEVAADNVLTSEEARKLALEKTSFEKWMQFTTKEKMQFMVWFSDSLQFINEFNQSIDCIVEHLVTKDTLKILSNGKSIFDRDTLLAMKYPIEVAVNWQEMVANRKAIRFNAGKSDSLITIEMGGKKAYLDSMVLRQFCSWNSKPDTILTGNKEYILAGTDSILFSNVEIAVLNYQLNLASKEASIGIFTRANNKLRQENIQKETIRIRKKLFDIFT